MTTDAQIAVYMLIQVYMPIQVYTLTNNVIIKDNNKINAKLR